MYDRKVTSEVLARFSQRSREYGTSKPYFSISGGAERGTHGYVIQKAVELGVYEIIPVEMKYCVVRLDDKKKEKKESAGRRLQKSAIKQAKRSRIPEIHPVMSYDKAVEYAKNCQLCLAIWRMSVA